VSVTLRDAQAAPFCVAVIGPPGSGRTSLSRRLACRLEAV